VPLTDYLLAPWRCLCRGFLLQITRTTPFLRMMLQCSQIVFTEGLTFMRIHAPLYNLSPEKASAIRIEEII
jgi:hypothetical protein